MRQVVVLPLVPVTPIVKIDLWLFITSVKSLSFDLNSLKASMLHKLGLKITASAEFILSQSWFPSSSSKS